MIMRKVLSCFFVFVILMSVVPSSAFAMRDNNSVSGKTTRLVDTEAKAASVLEIKFIGIAVERCGIVAGADYWIVNVEELISGPPWSGKLTVYTINIFADSPIWGHADPDITVGDKVEVYGKCKVGWGVKSVTLNGNENYYIKKTDGTTKCGKITNWKTACTNVQLGGKFGAEMDFDNLMAGGYRFKGIVLVRSPTGVEYSGENPPRFVSSSPNNHGKFAGGNTLYVKIPEGAATGKYDVKLELWNVDINTGKLCDDTGWKENIFTVKDGGAVSEIVFIGTALEYHEASGFGAPFYWTVNVDKIISGTQPCSTQIDVITYAAINIPWGYADPNIVEGDKVEVYGKYYEDQYVGCGVTLGDSNDYYIKKSSSSASIKITSVSPPPGTTVNAGDTVTFTVNVDYDLGPNDYGKIRLSVNQYTTGVTDKEYSIGIFDPHSGSYTFTPHTETIGDDWENVYVTVKLYAAKQGKPLPKPYTDFDYKHYPVGGKGEGSLLHFDLDYKGTEPASGKGDGSGQHQIYAQPGQSFVMYLFYEEGNAGNQYIIRAYPEWDKKSFILNSDNDESTSELAQEMGGHRYDVENYVIPSVPGEYKIKVVYSNSAAPPTWAIYNRLLGEFTVIVGGGGDCFETVPSNLWKGEYYNNKNLDGSPSMVRNDGDADRINFDWGYDSPSTACGIGSDFFSVRWTRTLNFDSGTWRFTATTDDGMRVYVDGSLVIDKWFNQVATTYIADVDLTAGTHTIKVEYYEYDQTAVAKLGWEKDDGKEVKFTGTATDYWVSGGQIHHWTVLVDEVIDGPQPCEDQVDITVYDSEVPSPWWGYVDPNLNIGDRVEVYGRYYDGHCSAMHLHGSTDYYIRASGSCATKTVTLHYPKEKGLSEVYDFETGDVFKWGDKPWSEFQIWTLGDNTICGECAHFVDMGTVDICSTEPPPYSTKTYDISRLTPKVGHTYGVALGCPVKECTQIHILACDGNSVTFEYEEEELPDLTLLSDDISFSNPSPAVGETVTITAIIHNIGTISANDVIVQFFDGDPDNSGTQIGDDQVIDLITAGGSEIAQIDWTVSSITNVYVVVDPYDSIKEVNEGNNVAYKLVSGALSSEANLDMILKIGTHFDGIDDYVQNNLEKVITLYDPFKSDKEKQKIAKELENEYSKWEFNDVQMQSFNSFVNNVMNGRDTITFKQEENQILISVNNDYEYRVYGQSMAPFDEIKLEGRESDCEVTFKCFGNEYSVSIEPVLDITGIGVQVKYHFVLGSINGCSTAMLSVSPPIVQSTPMPLPVPGFCEEIELHTPDSKIVLTFNDFWSLRNALAKCGAFIGCNLDLYAGAGGGVTVGVNMYVKTPYEKMLNDENVGKIYACFEETYLFSIGPEFENDLNEGIISEELRDIFNTEGFPLSEEATVTKVEDNNKWKITDEEKIYFVMKEDGKINIYEEKSRVSAEDVVQYVFQNFDCVDDYLTDIRDSAIVGAGVGAEFEAGAGAEASACVGAGGSAHVKGIVNEKLETPVRHVGEIIDNAKDLGIFLVNAHIVVYELGTIPQSLGDLWNLHQKSINVFNAGVTANSKAKKLRDETTGLSKNCQEETRIKGYLGIGGGAEIEYKVEGQVTGKVLGGVETNLKTLFAAFALDPNTIINEGYGGGTLKEVIGVKIGNIAGVAFSNEKPIFKATVKRTGTALSSATGTIRLEEQTGINVTMLSDSGVDLNADGLYDYLTVDSTIEVTGADNYTIFGLLFNDSICVGSTGSITYLTQGNHSFMFNFSGIGIRNTGNNGSYTIGVMIGKENSNTTLFVSYSLYNTSHYNYTDFQDSPLRITNITSHGVDLDIDGLYNYLRAEIEVNTTKKQNITLEGYLTEGYLMGYNLTQVDLNPGINLIQIDFDGMSIREYGLNDTYSVFVSTYTSNGIHLDSDKAATSHYNFTDFQRPNISLTNEYGDIANDTDGDELYDYLGINVGVDVKEPGSYTIDAYLTGNKTYIYAYNRTYLDIGSHNLLLNFDGLTIRQSHVNQSYNLTRLRLFDDNGTIFGIRENPYVTSMYNYTEFQLPDIKLIGEYSDKGVDVDSNELYNYLSVDVGLDVNKEGYYTVIGYLNCNNSFVYAENTTLLEGGDYFVKLNFEGESIYEIGVNGSYQVEGIGIIRNGKYIDDMSRTYNTLVYNYTDFEKVNKPPIASFTYSPENPVVNQTITFNASSSSDLDGYILKYEWDFDDGNVTNTTEEIITHSYSSAGDYTVKLTVTDNDGAVDTETKNVTVYGGNGTTLPEVTIISPEEGTIYPTTSVDLIYTVNEPTKWIGYSLDGAENITLIGNTTLEKLKNGQHNLTIYAEDFAGNVGSNTINFSVFAIAPSISTIKVSPTYALSGDAINISADVFDSSGTRCVRAFISKGGEDVGTIFMSNPDEDGIYTGTWSTVIFTESGIYNIDISATETDGNEALAKGSEIEIA